MKGTVFSSLAERSLELGSPINFVKSIASNMKFIFCMFIKVI